MPKLSRDTAQMLDHGIVTEYRGTLAEYTVNFATFLATIDGAPLLKGAPGDRCHAPHWGYVLRGELGFVVDGVEETYKAGEAFYVAPGHTPTATADTEVVMFSPTKELSEVEAVMERNMKAMTPGS